MPLSERQEKAEALARELGKLGANVVSLMPLDEAAKGIRVQILDSDRKRIEAIVREWGWRLEYLQYQPRITYAGMTPACVFEIQIERPRIPVRDDRTIRGDIAERYKPSAEVTGMRKYLGITK